MSAPMAEKVVTVESFLQGLLDEINTTFAEDDDPERRLQRLRTTIRVRLAALEASTRLTDAQVAGEVRELQQHPGSAVSADEFVASLRDRMAASGR